MTSLLNGATHVRVAGAAVVIVSLSPAQAGRIFYGGQKMSKSFNIQ
jgi:hypothetical protein